MEFDVQQEDGITMELEPSKPSITDSICMMEPIMEGRVLRKTDFSLERDNLMDTAHPGGTNTYDCVMKPWSQATENKNDEIFLVDLEKINDGTGVKLKPQAKKFTLTSVLQANWAQNWFFK